MSSEVEFTRGDFGLVNDEFGRVHIGDGAESIVVTADDLRWLVHTAGPAMLHVIGAVPEVARTPAQRKLTPLPDDYVQVPNTDNWQTGDRASVRKDVDGQWWAVNATRREYMRTNGPDETAPRPDEAAVEPGRPASSQPDAGPLTLDGTSAFGDG